MSGLASPSGEAVPRTASTAAATTSARITMPGPPPAGVSSTERCRSVAKSRISTASRVHSRASSALPASDTPSGPGNISGQSVSTVADQLSLINRSRFRSLIRKGADRRVDHDLAALSVHKPHIIDREPHQHRLAAPFGSNFEQVTRTEIQHRRDMAIAPTIFSRHTEPDEIGVIPAFLILIRLRQAFARHMKLGSPERIGCVTVFYALKPAQNEILDHAFRLDGEAA